MNDTARDVLNQMVHNDHDVEVIIVRHRDGSTDFFTSEPDAVECQRPRIALVCRQIASQLESMRAPTRRGPGLQSCPDAGESSKASGCPA